MESNPKQPSFMMPSVSLRSQRRFIADQLAVLSSSTAAGQHEAGGVAASWSSLQALLLSSPDELDSLVGNLPLSTLTDAVNACVNWVRWFPGPVQHVFAFVTRQVAASDAALVHGPLAQLICETLSGGPGGDKYHSDIRLNVGGAGKSPVDGVDCHPRQLTCALAVRLCLKFSDKPAFDDVVSTVISSVVRWRCQNGVSLGVSRGSDDDPGACSAVGAGDAAAPVDQVVAVLVDQLIAAGYRRQHALHLHSQQQPSVDQKRKRSASTTTGDGLLWDCFWLDLGGREALVYIPFLLDSVLHAHTALPGNGSAPPSAQSTDKLIALVEPLLTAMRNCCENGLLGALGPDQLSTELSEAVWRVGHSILNVAQFSPSGQLDERLLSPLLGWFLGDRAETTTEAVDGPPIVWPTSALLCTMVKEWRSAAVWNRIQRFTELAAMRPDLYSGLMVELARYHCSAGRTADQFLIDLCSLATNQDHRLANKRVKLNNSSVNSSHVKMVVLPAEGCVLLSQYATRLRSAPLLRILRRILPEDQLVGSLGPARQLTSPLQLLLLDIFLSSIPLTRVQQQRGKSLWEWIVRVRNWCSASICWIHEHEQESGNRAPVTSESRWCRTMYAYFANLFVTCAYIQFIVDGQVIEIPHFEKICLSPSSGLSRLAHQTAVLRWFVMAAECPLQRTQLDMVANKVQQEDNNDRSFTVFAPRLRQPFTAFFDNLLESLIDQCDNNNDKKLQSDAEHSTTCPLPLHSWSVWCLSASSQGRTQPWFHLVPVFFLMLDRLGKLADRYQLDDERMKRLAFLVIRLLAAQSKCDSKPRHPFVSVALDYVASVPATSRPRSFQLALATRTLVAVMTQLPPSVKSELVPRGTSVSPGLEPPYSLSFLTSVFNGGPPIILSDNGGRVAESEHLAGLVRLCASLCCGATVECVDSCCVMLMAVVGLGSIPVEEGVALLCATLNQCSDRFIATMAKSCLSTSSNSCVRFFELLDSCIRSQRGGRIDDLLHHSVSVFWARLTQSVSPSVLEQTATCWFDSVLNENSLFHRPHAMLLPVLRSLEDYKGVNNNQLYSKLDAWLTERPARVKAHRDIADCFRNDGHSAVIARQFSVAVAATMSDRVLQSTSSSLSVIKDVIDRFMDSNVNCPPSDVPIIIAAVGRLLFHADVLYGRLEQVDQLRSQLVQFWLDRAVQCNSLIAMRNAGSEQTVVSELTRRLAIDDDCPPDVTLEAWVQWIIEPSVIEAPTPGTTAIQHRSPSSCVDQFVADALPLLIRWCLHHCPSATNNSAETMHVVANLMRCLRIFHVTLSDTTRFSGVESADMLSILHLVSVLPISLLSRASKAHDTVAGGDHLFRAAYFVVRAAWKFRQSTTADAMPLFLACLKRLLHSFGRHSEAHGRSSSNFVVETGVKLDASHFQKQRQENASLFARLLEEVCTARNHNALRKHVPHLIADYLLLLENNDYDPDTAVSLQNAMFSVMKVCSDHEFSQIHTNSTQTCQTLFQELVKRFKATYKYSGKA